MDGESEFDYINYIMTKNRITDSESDFDYIIKKVGEICSG